MAQLTQLVCPSCGGALSLSGGGASCASCGSKFIVEAGAPPKLDPDAIPSRPEEMIVPTYDNDAVVAGFREWLCASPYAELDVARESCIETVENVYLPYYRFVVEYDANYSCQIGVTQAEHYRVVKMQGGREVGRSGVKTRYVTQWQGHHGRINGTLDACVLAARCPAIEETFDAQLARNRQSSDSPDIMTVFGDKESHFLYDAEEAQEHGFVPPTFEETAAQAWGKRGGAMALADAKVAELCVQNAPSDMVRFLKKNANMRWDARSCLVPFTIVKYTYKKLPFTFVCIPSKKVHIFGTRPVDRWAAMYPPRIWFWLLVICAIASIVAIYHLPLELYPTARKVAGAAFAVCAIAAATIRFVMPGWVRRRWQESRLRKIAEGARAAAG